MGDPYYEPTTIMVHDIHGKVFMSAHSGLFLARNNFLDAAMAISAELCKL